MKGPVAKELYKWQQAVIERMKAEGSSAQEIADRLGISKSTVYHRWNGKCCPYCGVVVVDAIAYRDDEEFRCLSCLEFLQGDMWSKYASERLVKEMMM